MMVPTAGPAPPFSRIIATATCEAVVQRVQDFLDPADAATTPPAAPHLQNPLGRGAQLRPGSSGGGQHLQGGSMRMVWWAMALGQPRITHLHRSSFGSLA